MLRVLHVIGPLNVGGAQTQLLGLLRAGHGSRWHATLCATAPGPMLAEFRATGAPVIELDRERGPAGRARQLRSCLDEGAVDVVHANLWHPNAYARLAVAGRRDRPAVVISERNVEVHRRRGHRVLDRALARWTDVYVGNSQAVCEFIAEVHPVSRADVVHIANAVDKATFHADPGGHDRGAALQVGAVGRLCPEKGFEVLIDAVRCLADRMEVALDIAGNGPLRRDLERRASGLPVRFRGELERGRPVAEFLRSLDLFVLPSTHREGRANVLLEAMSCGVPTVATDIAGMLEAVGGGATLARPGDPESLAEAIAATAADPTARTRVLDQASTIPDFEALADAYLSVFERARSALVRG